MKGGTRRNRARMTEGVYRWRERIWASRSVPHGCRLMLVLFAEYMNADRTVSVPREQLALELGVHASRISEWVAIAIEAGYLVRVAPGYDGHTAVYQGTRPDYHLAAATSPGHRHPGVRKS